MGLFMYILAWFVGGIAFFTGLYFLGKQLCFWQKITFFYCANFGRTYLCKCGHRAKWKTRLVVNGREGLYTLANKEYCPQCFAGAAIKCAWCGDTIFPGDPITLYTPKKDFAIPEHAVVHKTDPLELVGCFDWNCAESGADRRGFWVMPGKVQRVLSPLEMIFANGPLGKPVIVNDLSDPREAIPIPDKIA
jgi:hypothetical protein